MSTVVNLTDERTRIPILQTPLSPLRLTEFALAALFSSLSLALEFHLHARLFPQVKDRSTSPPRRFEHLFCFIAPSLSGFYKPPSLPPPRTQQNEIFLSLPPLPPVKALSLLRPELMQCINAAMRSANPRTSNASCSG